MIVYILTFVSLFITDGFLKFYMEKHLRPEETKQIGSGRIVLKQYHNTGAMFNMGAARQPLIALVSLVFSAFVAGIYAATLGTKGKRTLKMGLSLILGGAFSNTYDRLKRRYVVDYISFRFGTPRFKPLQGIVSRFEGIVYNLSDFGIIIGAVLLVCGVVHES